MKKFVTVVGGIIGLLPWIDQIIDLNLIPDYWEHGSNLINIAVSVLCFVCVGLLYNYKAEISKSERRLIVKGTILFFTLFVISIITLIVLLNRTYKTVGDCCYINEEDKCLSNKVFIPLFLPDEVYKYQEERNYSLSAWVDRDQCHVNELLAMLGKDKIAYSFNFTMILIFLNYLSVFLFVILSVLPIAFYSTENIKQIE